MKVLITGGFGFVGGRLASFLCGEGHEIVLGSRNYQEIPEWCPEAKTVVTNWNDIDSLLEACKGIDCIIHAAGMNKQDCSVDPESAVFANAITTKNLVECAIKAGVKKFIYFSTAHVYNNTLEGNITEATPPRNQHPYATSHRMGEDYVLAAHAEGKLQGLAFRLSNSFGTPIHKEVNVWFLLVNDICKQAVANEEIVLKSSGQHHRDFIGLDAVSKCIAKSLVKTFPKENNTLFNLGSGTSMTILEMAEMVSKRYEHLTGKKIIVQREKPNPNLNHEQMIYSVEKLKKNDLFFQSDFNAEIDSLLQFCKKKFMTYASR